MKSYLYFAAFAVLTYMLGIQVSHLAIDLGIAMSAAIILGINVGWSFVFELVKKGVWIALIVAPILLYGNLQSVDASQRAFAQKSHQKILDQSENPVAILHKNQMTLANNQLINLTNQGITSGVQYDRAMQQFNAAKVAFKDSASDRQTSAAELALTGGDESKNTGELVQKKSRKNSWLLELLCVALSILLGLGDGMSKRAMGILTPTKKPQAVKGNGQ